MKVAILGLAGAGKDTVAKMIHDVTKEKFAITRFAEPLKRASLSVFGTQHDDRDQKNKAVPVTPKLSLDMEIAAAGTCQSLTENYIRINDMRNNYLNHFESLSAVSPRLYQQLLGTEVIRAVCPDAFVDRVKRLNGNWVVPDCRFENELLDVNIIVYRPDCEWLDHESEDFTQWLYSWIQENAYTSDAVGTEIDGKFYHIIQNFGTLEELKQDVITTLHYANIL